MEANTIFKGDIFDYIIVNYLNNRDIIGLYYAELINEDRMYNCISIDIENQLKNIFSDKYHILKEYMIKYDIGLSGLQSEIAAYQP